MSWTALLENEAFRTEDDASQPPLEWLLAMLRQAMEALMADEAAKPLQKANAIARLGSLYLKTYRAAELQQQNKALLRRVAELEDALHQGGGPGGTPSGTPEPALARTGSLPPAVVPVAMEKQVAGPVAAERGNQQAARGRRSKSGSTRESRSPAGPTRGTAAPAPS